MWTAATPPDSALPKAAIAVIGAGLMGHGIAQIFAAAGHDVALHDPLEAALAAAPERIAAVFELLGQDAAGPARNSYESAAATAAEAADFVVEAAPEKLEIKTDIFARLDQACKPDAVLASNTSVIPIGDVGAGVRDGGRVVGTHFWNPPFLVPLVEVVQAASSDPAIIRRVMDLLTSIGKQPVHVRRDIPGFIGNRLQHALKREAIALVADGVCDAETIDLVVKSGFGARLAVLGPMEQSDLVGLGLTLDIHKVLLADLDTRDGPHPYLVDKVAKGEVGMASGKGFRDWTPETADEVRRRLADYLAAAAKTAREAAREEGKD